MISSAKANFQRISPRKARMIVNLIRGRDANEALQILDFTFKAGAPFLKKLLASALANAKQRHPNVDLDSLYISRATADKGRTHTFAAGGRALKVARPKSRRA
jgi:large subunit ribosomal protein L22